MQKMIKHELKDFLQSEETKIIKGNVAAGGGKQYYLTNHRYYEVIEVDIDKGERWFCSEKDAIRMGFKKAK